MIHHAIRFIFLCCLLLPGFESARAAQDNSPAAPDRTETPPFIPALRVRGAEQPVRLRELSVRAVVQGGFAEIGLDMIFFNPNGRVLEGELQFPLSPGQEISGLALDVGGEMRDGVPVPKARGQEIFETIARRNVDPALLEATRGNSYKLRVYPIPANGTRRVAVRILQPLAKRDGMFTLRLPLNFAEHLDKFSVEALVAAGEAPKVESGTLGLALEPAGALYRGRVEKADLTPEGWLVVGVPAASALDKNFNAVRWGDKIYFTAVASVESKTKKRVPPKITTLVWDASGSGEGRDHAREYALLDSYFAAMGDGIARLVVVRDVAEAPREFSVDKGGWRELKAYLHALPYDGGTDLASWKPSDDCSEYLLFSDGLANFGGSLAENVLPAMSPGQRLYAIASSTEADHNLLRHASRGRLIDLLRHDDAAAARLLLEDAARVSVAPEELAGKGEMLLDPFSSPADSGVRVAGWIKARNSARPETITMWAEHPDGRREPLAFTVSLDDSVPVHAGEDAPLAARLWGRYAIAAMEANAHRHKAEILRLGRELGVTSRETSLIVLETAGDYVRYNVAPPASLKAEVEALRAGGAAPDDSVAYLPMERLQGMWAEKVAWWEKDFSSKRFAKMNRRAEPESVVNEEREVWLADESGGERFSRFSAARDDAASFSPASAAPMMMAESASPEAPAASAKAGDKAIGIALQAWRSDAPYVRRLNRAKEEDMYAVYLDERPGYGRNSGFFLDMADRFFKAGMPALGLRILSNLAEMEVENRQLLRMLAYRLLEAKEARLALGIFERVHELAPYEPQSLRDLAAAHAALGNREQAAELLYEVARREWDERFADINTIALTELNALVATAKEPMNTAAFDSRLMKNLASDLRVVLTWDADNTDMDLWVVDPNGEKCSYDNRLTRQGGAMSGDCTGGYGPEEFMLRKALPGVYRVEVEYYGGSRQILGGDVTLYVALTTGFGTAGQKERVVTMRLKKEKERIFVGEFAVQ